jgi:hypothetical protein
MCESLLYSFIYKGYIMYVLLAIPIMYIAIYGSIYIIEEAIKE